MKLLRLTLIAVPIVLLVLYSFSTVGKTKKEVTNSNKMNKVKVEIWSDMVCPFCFIGKKKLEKAIATLAMQDQVEIVWHSYQLDPYFPKDTSISATKHLIEKKGISENQLNGMYQNLVNSGKNYGIDFNFEKSLSFNTFDAHRLWHWSKQFGKQNEWKEAVMIAYFTEGIDLSKKENLMQIVTDLGLDSLSASQVLNSDSYASEVENDIYQSNQLQIQGVPYFLVNGKDAISGAQDDKVFEKVLKSALSEIE